MEKAQTLRTKHGAEHGYRCRRCGQPKRGHVCPALSSEAVEGEEALVRKGAELGAYATQRIKEAAARPVAPPQSRPRQLLQLPPDPRLPGEAAHSGQ